MMRRSPTPRDALLYKYCDEVLHYIWDPIDLAGVPQARDEYDSYVPAVWQLVSGGADSTSIATYLLEVETAAMGLPGKADKARHTADVLLAWRDWLQERHAAETPS